MSLQVDHLLGQMVVGVSGSPRGAPFPGGLSGGAQPEGLSKQPPQLLRDATSPR